MNHIRNRMLLDKKKIKNHFDTIQALRTQYNYIETPKKKKTACPQCDKNEIETKLHCLTQYTKCTQNHKTHFRQWQTVGSRDND